MSEVFHEAPKPQMFTVNGVPILALPAGWESESHSEFLPTGHAQLPAFIRRTMSVVDNDSFVAYYKRFATPATLHEVSRNTYALVATLDFHASAEARNHASHLLTRRWQLSKQFGDWKAKNGLRMNQKVFAEFLEDRVLHLSTMQHAPVAQSELLQAVLQFKATQGTSCTAAHNMTNGDVKFEFTRETKVLSAELPEKLLLQIPVFEFGISWEIHARLRYELKEQALVFWFDLVQVDELIENALDQEIQILRSMLRVGDQDAAPDFILTN